MVLDGRDVKQSFMYCLNESRRRLSKGVNFASEFCTCTIPVKMKLFACCHAQVTGFGGRHS